MTVLGDVGSLWTASAIKTLVKRIRPLCICKSGRLLLYDFLLVERSLKCLRYLLDCMHLNLGI